MAEAYSTLRGKKVYVAGPYGDSAPIETRKYRYNKILQACADLVSAGVRAYAPVAYAHNLAKLGSFPPDGWYGFDLSMLPMFEYVLLLKLPGWDESRGVELELEEAANLNIPVLAVDRD